MKQIILCLSLCFISSVASSQVASVGSRLGYSGSFPLKSDPETKKELKYRGPTLDVFYRYKGKGNFAVEAGLQYGRITRSVISLENQYWGLEPYIRKDYLSIPLSIQYQLESWNISKHALRIYAGVVLVPGIFQTTTRYGPGCFGTPQTARDYSASLQAGVNQSFVYEMNKAISLQSNVSFIVDPFSYPVTSGQLNTQLGASYRISP